MVRLCVIWVMFLISVTPIPKLQQASLQLATSHV